MKLSGHISKFEFDKGAFYPALEERLKRAIKAALAEFLDAAAGRVPVRTGMARGSLGPISRYLNVAIDLSEAQPTKREGPRQGAALTTFEVEFTTEPFSFHVKLHIGTEHYNYLDVQQGRSPTSPWGSIQAGKEAYQNYVSQAVEHELRDLDIIKYFKRVTVKY